MSWNASGRLQGFWNDSLRLWSLKSFFKTFWSFEACLSTFTNFDPQKLAINFNKISLFSSHSYVFSAPETMIDSIPGTLMLTDCLEQCQTNDSCSSVNYETGLCILFSSNADKLPGKLHGISTKSEEFFKSTRLKRCANNILRTMSSSCLLPWLNGFEKMNGKWNYVRFTRRAFVLKKLSRGNSSRVAVSIAHTSRVFRFLSLTCFKH